MPMRTLAFLLTALLASSPAFAAPKQATKPPVNEIDSLFSALSKVESDEEAKPIEDKIMAAFLRSGSPTVDLLMTRAAAAIQANDTALATKLVAAVTNVAPDYAEGMGASLRTGIASLPADTDGAFVFLGDMPRVPTAIFGQMVQALIGGALAAAPVYRGQRGNPVLLDRTLFPQLLALTGDAGARGVLQDLGERLVLIESPDDGVLFDVDEPGDLAR